MDKPVFITVHSAFWAIEVSKRMARGKLTAKQMAFCRAYASGMTMADSYREAFSAENMKPAVVRNEASKLFARHDIAMTVEGIRGENSRLQEARSLGDRERVLERFRHWMEQGCDDPLKIRAAEGLARASGLFRDQTDVTVSSRDSTAVAGELERRLGALLSSGQEQAKAERDAEDMPPDAVH